MNSLFDEAELLFGKIIDGIASEDDRSRANAIIAEHGEFASIWAEQCAMHGVLSGYVASHRRAFSLKMWGISLFATAAVAGTYFAVQLPNPIQTTSQQPVQQPQIEEKEMKTITKLAAVAVVAATTHARDLTWSGANGNDWSAADNWRISGETTTATFQDGDIVRFDDDATTFSVNITTPVKPSAVYFSSTQDYTLSGGTKTVPGIQGTSSLTKTGSGTLTITGMHNYTGDILLQEGIVQNISGMLNINEWNSTWSFLGNPRVERTIEVTTGGILKILDNGAFGNGNGSQPLFTLKVTGGRVENPYGGYAMYGAAIFDNAEFVITNGIREQWLNVSFNGPIQFRGTQPTVITDIPNRSTSKGATGIMLSPANGSHTVIDVPEIVEGNASDAHIQARIGASENIRFPDSGFDKTGGGILEISDNYSTYTGTVRVLEGTLRASNRYDANHAGLTGNFGVLGYANLDHDLYVAPGATLEFAGNNLQGMVYNKSKLNLTVDGGTFRSKANCLNNLGPTVFNNATIDIENGTGTKWTDLASPQKGLWPTIGVNTSIRFSGSTPYTIPFLNGAYWSFGCSDQMADIIVDKIAEKESDLLWSGYIANADTEWRGHAVRNHGFRKLGAGTMEICDIRSTFTGDVVIVEGKLKLNPSNHNTTVSRICGPLGNMCGELPRTITVLEGATLEYAQQNCHGHANSHVNMTTVLDGGTLLLKGAEICNCLGNLDFRNGHMVYSQGNGAWGIAKLGAFIKFSGDTPYNFPLATRYCAFALSFLNDYVYEDDHKKGNTEWIVADITKDDQVDVNWEPPLINGAISWYENYTIECGLKKSGAGTLRLTAANTYTGATEVVQGTLLVDGSLASTVSVGQGAFLGGTGTLGDVTIADGGGLAADFTQTSPLSISKLSAEGTVKVHVANIPAGTRNFKVPFAQIATQIGEPVFECDQNNVKISASNGTLYAMRSSGTVIMLLGN